MVPPLCEAYSSHTDLQQNLHTRLDHPGPCLAALKQAVPSTTQGSAQTCAHQLVVVTEIESSNSPQCLFTSRAREVVDFCLWCSRGGHPLCGARGRGGVVSPPVSLGLQCPATILILSPAPFFPNWSLSNPSAPGKSSQASLGQWCLPMTLCWCWCADVPGRSAEGDDGKLSWPGLALKHWWCWLSWVFLALSRSSRLDTPPGDLLYSNDFVTDFTEAVFGENMMCLTSLQIIWLSRHLLMLGCAFLPLPSMSLTFSVKENSNSTSCLPEKWRHALTEEDEGEGPCSHLWQFSRTMQLCTSSIPAGWCSEMYCSSVRANCSYRGMKTHTCIIFAGAIDSMRQTSFENTYSCSSHSQYWKHHQWEIISFNEPRFFFFQDKARQKSIVLQMSMYLCHQFILPILFNLRYFAYLFEILEDSHFPGNSASKAETETACPREEGYNNIFSC